MATDENRQQQLAFAGSVLDASPDVFPGLIGGGMSGPAVQRVGAALLALGYESDWSRGQNAGTYSGDMALALRSWRESADVHEPPELTPNRSQADADGYIGQATWDALMAAAQDAVQGAQTPAPADQPAEPAAAPQTAAQTPPAGDQTGTAPDQTGGAAPPVV